MDNWHTGGVVSDELTLMDRTRLCRVCGLLYFGGIPRWHSFGRSGRASMERLKERKGSSWVNDLGEKFFVITWGGHKDTASTRPDRHDGPVERWYLEYGRGMDNRGDQEENMFSNRAKGTSWQTGLKSKRKRDLVMTLVSQWSRMKDGWRRHREDQIRGRNFKFSLGNIKF